MKAKAVEIDCPWPYEVWSKKGQGRSAEAHYKTMTWQDLADLGPYVTQALAPKAAIFAWVCPPSLFQAHEVFARWGLTYVTKGFAWVKVSKRNAFEIGMGHRTRANTEDCLLYYWGGNPPHFDRGVSQVVPTLEEPPELPDEIAQLVARLHGSMDLQPPAAGDAPALFGLNLKHSRKPAEAKRRIMRLYDGPYLSIFDRRPFPYWTCLGNEVDGLDIRDSLSRYASDESIPLLPEFEQPDQFSLFGDGNSDIWDEEEEPIAA